MRDKYGLQKGFRQRWDLEGEIARGGMGRVERGWDTVMERESAMKILHADLLNDEEMTRRFVQEARITGRLEHPNIVPLHELGMNEKGELYFTMKLVQGKTYLDIMYDQTVRLDNQSHFYELLEIFVKVCDAMAYAHDRGVIHCDIKPENIMVGDFGQVYLMDWGIARVIDKTKLYDDGAKKRGVGFKQKTGVASTVLGTPEYMPPEQAYGELDNLDHRSDIYAMGVLLYEVLALKRPYEFESAMDVLNAVVKGNYKLPSEVSYRPAVPRTLEAIVVRAMSYERKDRYQSINEMKRDIQRFIRGETDFPVKTFKKGKVIIRQGDVGDAAYVIQTGACGVYVTTDGQDVLLKKLGPGDVFGETAILASSPRTASVVALEDSNLEVITKDLLERELESVKPWMSTVIRTLADRFRELSGQLKERLRVGNDRRVARQVVMHVKALGEATGPDTLMAQWTPLAKELSVLFAIKQSDLVHMLEPISGIDVNPNGDTVTVSNARELLDRLS